nr:hypothetical protein [Tanacetum cinerariifolium]
RKLNWDGPHMPLLAPMLIVPAGGDAAGAAANVAAGPGPSSALQVPPKREHLPVREHSSVGPTTSSRPPSPSRPPSGPTDIREGGGDVASSPPSNEVPQTPAATTAGGAEDSATLTALTLKLEDATTMEQEFDLAALHTLASATLGNDPSATAAGPDVENTMPGERTSTTRMYLRKPFTSSVSAHMSETIPPGVRVPATVTTIPAGSSVDADLAIISTGIISCVGDGRWTGFSCWFSTTLQMVFSSPWFTAKKELTHHEGTTLSWLVQEQTALGKDKSNLLMAVMVCQKPLGYFSSPMIHVPRAELVFNPPGYVVPAGSEHSHSCCCVPAGKHSFCCQ